MACNAALADMIDYLKQDGVRVAAFDATNSTRERRQHILQVLEQAGIGAKKMFVESVCDSQQLLEENIRKVKLSTPDYRGVDSDTAMKDFLKRREQYISVYEPVDERDGSYVKIINSKLFIANNIRGYLKLKVVHFVMNLHTLPRTFYFTRHGQSEYNLLGKIGGDSGLSPAGVEYAKRLAKFASDYIAKDKETGKPWGGGGIDEKMLLVLMLTCLLLSLVYNRRIVHGRDAPSGAGRSRDGTDSRAGPHYCPSGHSPYSLCLL
jgi:hypothetical protein